MRSTDPRWHHKGLIRKVLTESLSQEMDLLSAISSILTEWDGDGATSFLIPASDLKKYVSAVGKKKLLGPRRDQKTVGVTRYEIASVPAARLLTGRREYIRHLLEEHYIPNRPPLPTKIELAEQMESQREELEDQISELQTTVRRAGDAKRQAASRSLSARRDWQERCRERLQSARETLAEKAKVTAETAMQDEVERYNRLRNEANARARTAERRETTAKDDAANRLKALAAAQGSIATLTAESEELHEQVQNRQLRGEQAISKLEQIPHVGIAGVRRPDGKGGWRNWPNWMRAAIMEMYVNGTPSAAIPRNIVTMASYLIPFETVRVPTVRFCRHLRGELQIVTLTLAALMVMWAGKWRQLFTDGTSRRQTHFINAIIGIDGPDGALLCVILAATVIGSGESSEEQVEDILEKVFKRGASKVKRLREIFEELYPGVDHNIPDVSEMDIAKLAGGMISSDNCSPAMKVKRLLEAAVQDAVKHHYTAEQWDAKSSTEQAAELLVLQGDCWNHLRNVWIKSMSGALTSRLKESLRFELETIDSRLRVGTALDGVLRAADKEFSLCANYPKGHGDMFFEWMARCHPNLLLFHVVSTEGGRQDMVCEGAGPLYMNRRVWVEFLDMRLRVPSADNILQECLYISLTSVEMIASARVHAIIHLAIVTPHRWLAGNTHLLAEYDWSERSMGITVDLIERAMSKVADESDEHGPGELLFDQTFMLSIFDEIAAKLPPFKEYLTYMYEVCLPCLSLGNFKLCLRPNLSYLHRRSRAQHLLGRPSPTTSLPSFATSCLIHKTKTILLQPVSPSSLPGSPPQTSLRNCGTHRRQHLVTSLAWRASSPGATRLSKSMKLPSARWQ